MSFGENLKAIRTGQAVTQQELADYLRVTRPTIAGYETKGKEPDYETLSRIADFFHISIDSLIRGEALTISRSASNAGTSIMVRVQNDRADNMIEIIQAISELNLRDFSRLRDYLSLLRNQSDLQSKKANKKSVTRS